MSTDKLTDEQVLQLIQTRRTCYQFLDKTAFPLDKEKLNLCLQAALYAPNHKLTQPWRFWVLGDQTKTAIANVYADLRAKKRAITDPECYPTFYEKGLQKFTAIPTVILVGQVLNDDKVVRKEDYAACACAIQNFQLMAWQQSIGVQWSTGPIIDDARTYEILNIDANQIQLIGALYLGNIDGSCQPNQNIKRKSVNQVTEFCP